MKVITAICVTGALTFIAQPALAQDRPADPQPSAAMPSENASPTVQTTPSRTDNASAMPTMREYPPCRGEVQDSCINPREAGLNYGNRPLQYWPGRPASEITDPLPAQRPGNRPN